MTIEEAKIEATDLADKINYYNHQYYQNDISEISDLEFDQLLEKLIAIETQYLSVLEVQ